MKKAYIVATPSGRSIISILKDSRKALYKSQRKALMGIRQYQPLFRVKLKIKAVMISNRLYNQNF